MARLIIGHTTHRSVRIWVRGDETHPHAFVTVERPSGAPITKHVPLEARHIHTGVVEFTRLAADAPHTCKVAFGRTADALPMHRVDFGHCTGAFRTFPKKGSATPFSFLLGSCNLHTIWIFSSPEPAFETLAEKAVGDDAAFMIHCGDQIYADVPPDIFSGNPDLEKYRECYLDAWGSSRATRKFLTQLPQYMILDDHEIVDNFANDMGDANDRAGLQSMKTDALKAYREFAHIRHPDSFDDGQAYHYTFRCGDAEFFVLDTRTERRLNPRRDASGAVIREPELIGPRQMTRFKDWLKAKKNALKFVVTSVPFVGEVSDADDRIDKWNGPLFLRQREEILRHMAEHDIYGTVFLTGDMHTSYHATLTLTRPNGAPIVMHELMSSPINHLAKASLDYYEPRYTRQIGDDLQYESEIDLGSFYCDHSNAMLITVDGRSVGYDIFRTKSDKPTGKQGSFTVDEAPA